MQLKSSLHALFFLLLSLNSVTSFAAWKLESIQNMQVQLYTPEKSGWSKSLNNKRSLMINLHGCSQKAEDLMKDGNWVSTADGIRYGCGNPKSSKRRSDCWLLGLLRWRAYS